MGQTPHAKMVKPPNGFTRPAMLSWSQKITQNASSGMSAMYPMSEEDTMEAATLFLGMTLRIVLPIGILFWISARLRAWDQKRGAIC
jgi:hypothetical protein